MSPRFRAVALAGVAAVFALAVGFLLLGRGGSASSAVPKTIKPLHPVKKAARTKARQPAKRPGRPAVVNGLPAPLAQALVRHPVVVVSLYQPRSDVDEMAKAEARVGAASAGAGFVAVNVLNNAHMRALTNLLGSDQKAENRLLDDPAVLIFQQPKTLFLRFNGYADQQTVQQAAVNAAPLGTLHPVDNGASWVTQANATCTQMAQQMQLLIVSYLQSPPTGQTAVNGILGILDGTISTLERLNPPASLRADVHAMVADFRGASLSLRSALAAARQGDRKQAEELANKAQSFADKGEAIATRVGATGCAG